MVRPLVITEDPEVLDDVVRVAAARATEVLVCADDASIHRHWLNAPLVLIGMDQLERVARMNLQRRARVVTVSRAELNAVAERRAWQQAVALGVEHVVELPEGEQWLLDAFDDAGGSLGQIITVIGGSGGVGASTFAVNLAMTTRAVGHSVALVDLDPWSGGLDLLMGAERAPGLRWSALESVHGRVSARALADSCVHVGGIDLLSCDAADACPSPAVNAVIDALQRGYDRVIVDLSVPAIPAARELVVRSSQVLLVVAAHVHAAASAGRMAQWVRDCGQQPALVVVNTAKGLLAQEISLALELPLAAAVPFVASMAARSDAGELPPLPTAYRAECRNLVSAKEVLAA